MITNDIRPLLDRYVRFIGRGNMVPASLILVDVIKRLVLEIESSHGTNGQQSARPYDVAEVNMKAIHCMDKFPEPEADPEAEARAMLDTYDSYPEEANPDPDPEPEEADPDGQDEPLIEPLPVRRSRGRPRKHPLA